MADAGDVKVVRARRRLVAAGVALAILVVVGVIAIAASGGSDSPTTQSSAGATAAPADTQPAQPVASGAPQPSQPIGTAVGAVVTVAGSIKTLLPNGDFVVDDGGNRYTVVMSPATTITDIDGARATADLIQLGGSAQVTGTLTGNTLIADAVIVPTRAAPPATDA